jgi:phosphatidylinositol kinase/protein kinase (PI-3  family)
VHVDFNCLFWKGLTFEKPEKVPFRLTPNMSDALGLTRYEGVFRSVCEIALRVLRTNRETLMSVLETFIYDPLVEWSRGVRNSNAIVPHPTNSSYSRANWWNSLRLGKWKIKGPCARLVPPALLNLLSFNTSSKGAIEKKLSGQEKILRLSVEGQVHQQILEAISQDNLSQVRVKTNLGWTHARICRCTLAGLPGSEKHLYSSE